MPKPQTAAVLTPSELASRWELSPKTLANWRSLGSGPRWIKIGRAIRYPLADVQRVEAKGTAEVGIRQLKKARA